MNSVWDILNLAIKNKDFFTTIIVVWIVIPFLYWILNKILKAFDRLINIILKAFDRLVNIISKKIENSLEKNKNNIFYISRSFGMQYELELIQPFIKNCKDILIKNNIKARKDIISINLEYKFNELSSNIITFHNLITTGEEKLWTTCSEYIKDKEILQKVYDIMFWIDETDIKLKDILVLLQNHKTNLINKIKIKLN